MKFEFVDLDLGSIVNRVAKPILTNLKKVLGIEPINTLLEAMRTHIPFLTKLNDIVNIVDPTSDLSAGVSVLDVANKFAGSSPYVILVSMINTIDVLVQRVDTNTGLFSLGTVTLGGDPRSGLRRLGSRCSQRRPGRRGPRERPRLDDRHR